MPKFHIARPLALNGVIFTLKRVISANNAPRGAPELNLRSLIVTFHVFLSPTTLYYAPYSFPSFFSSHFILTCFTIKQETYSRELESY